MAFCNGAGAGDLRSVTNSELLVPKYKLSSYENSLSYSGANIWNNIPVNIRKASLLKNLKVHTKLYYSILQILKVLQ